MQHLEIEFKNLLKKTEYDQLRSLFPEVTPVHQTNYYIDSPSWTLREHGMSLRVRTFEKGGELTLKIPQAIGNMEYNQELPDNIWPQFPDQLHLPEGPILDLIQEERIDLEELRILGSLHTERVEIQLPIGLLAIDKSSYFDQIDYELELEVTNPAQGREDFENFLKEHNIEQRKAPTKVARFSAKL